MKKQTQINLEKIKIKPIAMHHHQMELRRVLLTSSHWDRKSMTFLSFLNGGEKIMLKNKIVTIGIVGVVIAVTAVSLNMFLPNNSKTAYAEQIAQNSIQKVSSLTPQEQDALKEKVHMDPNTLLQDAKNAKDLKTITYDEFVKEFPMVTMGFSTGGSVNKQYGKDSLPTPATQLDMKNLKYLEFTDKDDNKVVLGIDQNNLPVFSFSKTKNGVGMTIRDSKKVDAGVSMQQDGVGTSGQKSQVKMQNRIDDNGKGAENIVSVNGKSYKMPAGVDLSKEPPEVQTKADGVYINGVKAIPVE